MAQRRMFSPDIVHSDEFLEMPLSTQAFYFHLGMKADDDGFVNPRGLMRMVGFSHDDLKVLIAKRFVLPFEDGVIVMKHWRINNLVRKDWYRPTRYVEHKGTLYLKKNGAYTQDKEQGQPLVNEPLTEDRIDQDRLIGAPGVRIEKDPEEEKEPRARTVKPKPHIAVFALFGKYPRNWEMNKTQVRAAENLLRERGLGKVRNALAFYVENKETKYIPIILSPYDLDSKWLKLLSFKKKHDL